MGGQFPAHAVGRRLAAGSRLPCLAVPLLDPLRSVAGGGVSLALYSNLPSSLSLRPAPALVGKLSATGGLRGAVVAAAAADCRRPRARGPLCGLLEFPIAALAPLSSRLLESGRLAGTYL